MMLHQDKLAEVIIRQNITYAIGVLRCVQPMHWSIIYKHKEK